MARLLAGSFRFDGKTIAYQDGDTVGSALHRAGVRTIGRSMKYHRPRGMYCVTGSCAQCFVDVDGVPNVPACMRPAQDASVVTSQNRIGSAKRDLLSVVDTVYPDGFEPHEAFTRPRLLNQMFVRAARFMSGWGKAPALGTVADDTPRRRTRHVRELIIGAGRHGLERAKIAAPDGDVLLIDEMDHLGGSAAWDPTEHDVRVLADAAPIWDGVETWTGALAFGIYGGVVAVRRGNDLWEITADRVTVCPGQHDGVPLFAGNDRPGILSRRGAARLFHEHGVLPGRRIAVHGDPLPESFVDALAAKGAQIVATGHVLEARGSPVRCARYADASVECDAIICNVPGVPRIELFQQAGCDLTFDHALRPVTKDDGATSQPTIYAGLA